jgi:hypothetical protein
MLPHCKLQLHVWRKKCANCGCPREVHDIEVLEVARRPTEPDLHELDEEKARRAREKYLQGEFWREMDSLLPWVCARLLSHTTHTQHTDLNRRALRQDPIYDHDAARCSSLKTEEEERKFHELNHKRDDMLHFAEEAEDFSKGRCV